MRDVLCWTPERVTDIINVEADAMPAAVFWAVDTDTPVHCKEGEQGAAVDLTTDTLVGRFLSGSRSHMQLAVLGPSGAGKSHLIRRLQQRIEGREGLEVLVVQRLETNLRAILDKLIRTLPLEDRGRYQEELQQAGYSLTSPDVQKSALLDGLAQAIQEDRVRSDSGIEGEAEAWLLEKLPDLLRDPYLRLAKFLKDGEIVPELVDRLFSSREGKRVDERLLFDSHNLPLEGIELLKVSSPVREVVEYCLYDQAQTIPQVLLVINRNLDRAIARTLNFSGERLFELMETLRRRLHQNGRELILLFEEFARLQGYDSAMLEALLKQGGSELCNVRWAIACTSGRFRDLPDTVRSRMDLIVDMEGEPPRFDLAAFSGRYQNAVRLGRKALDAQFESDPSSTVANACDQACQWRSECHAAFGTSEDGYGLYPFTASALRTMALRADPDAESRFNPRTFQRNVLRVVLADEARHIAADAFPTASLLAGLGGAQDTPADRARLQDKAGARADRYLSLFQLWSDGRLINPPEGVVRAFGLEPLNGLGDAMAMLPPSQPPHPPGPDAKSQRSVAKANPLGAWMTGEMLEQTLAQKLRVRLFPLIEQAIDWDMEGLSGNLFSGATGSRPFRQTSINFLRQSTSGAAPPPVRFELPLQRDEAGSIATARALDALLSYDAAAGWEPVGGLEALAAVRELVGACATEVMAQLKALRDAGGVWDPVIGAIELLLIGAGLGGRFTARMADEDLVGAVFASMPDDNAASEGALRPIYELLKRRRMDLQTLVRAHVSGSKGGQQGRFIDPRAVLAGARRLRRNKWALSGQPAALQAPYADVSKDYDRIARDLRPALEDERRGRVAWLEEVEAALGDEENRQVILNAVTALLDKAVQAGIPTRRTALENAKATFATVQFADAVRATRTLRTAEVPEAELAAFARGRTDAMAASRSLLKAWSDFIREAGAEVAARSDEHGVTALESELGHLNKTLGGLVEQLGALEAGDVAV